VLAWVAPSFNTGQQCWPELHRHSILVSSAGLSCTVIQYWSAVLAWVALQLRLARTIYTLRIWLSIWRFPCQTYRIYTEYVWFWPTLTILNHWAIAMTLMAQATLPLASGQQWWLKTHHHKSLINRVGQNRIYTPYMTVYLMISLPKILYIHRIYMVLANPINQQWWLKTHHHKSLINNDGFRNTIINH